MKTVSYNKIDALESDYLYIETSQLPNAGNGLFTAIDIYNEEMVAIFKGEILVDVEAKIRASSDQDRYFIVMLDGKILDCMYSDCFARYANDASFSPQLAFKHNTKIAVDEDNNIGLIAIRSIKAGEEIFCQYGKSYWKKWQSKI